MKNLRTTKIAGLFLSIGFACLLSSCDKNDGVVSPDSVPVGNISAEQVQYDPQMDAIAKALAASMGEESVRTLIKTEALKKFDGDYDILYQKIGNQNVGGKTLNTVLNEYSQKGNGSSRTLPIGQIATQMPLLNISVPVNAEKWNTSNFEPLVVISPSSVVKDETKLTVVKAYDKAGKVHWLDAKKAPDFPVVVVGLNERVQVLANGQTELKKGLVFASNGEDKKQVENEEAIEGGGGSGGGGGSSGPGGGGILGTDGCPVGSNANSIPGGGQNGVNYPNGSEDYIEWLYCQDGNAWEGWFDGGPEFYFQGGGANSSVESTSRFTENNIPFYVYNYGDLQGTWGYNCSHTSLGRWLPKHGGIVTHIWYEEDTGTQRTQSEPIRVKYNGQENTTNLNRIVLDNDDRVGTFQMDRDNGPCYIYGSNTFKYKVTRRFL